VRGHQLIKWLQRGGRSRKPTVEAAA